MSDFTANSVGFLKARKLLTDFYLSIRRKKTDSELDKTFLNVEDKTFDKNPRVATRKRNIYMEFPKLVVSTKVSMRPIQIESSTRAFFDWPLPSSPKSKRKNKQANKTDLFLKQRSKSVDVTRLKRIPKETSLLYKNIDGPQHVVYESGRVEYTRGSVNQYIILNSIGSGAFGKVNLCKDELTSEFFACKVISKNRLLKKFRWSHSGPKGVDLDHLSAIRREIDILKNMSHPHINPLIEYIDDPVEDNLYMIFELCEYGSIMKMKMHDKVAPYCEDLARKLFIDILLGLEYLHYRGIIHRDIKPENLLLTADGIVQIADFGISLMVKDRESDVDSVVNEKNASPLFCPPEACKADTKHLFGPAIDIWSLGVTLFCLLHGYCPFEDSSNIGLNEKIINDDPTISTNLSKEAQQVLREMLVKDPLLRISLPELKVHPWVEMNGSILGTMENCFEPEIIDETGSRSRFMGMIRTMGGSPTISSNSLSRLTDSSTSFLSLSKRNNKSFDKSARMSLKRNSVEFSTFFKRRSSSEMQKVESARRSNSGSSLCLASQRSHKTTDNLGKSCSFNKI